MEKLAQVVSEKRLLIWDFDGTIATLNVDWSALKDEIRKLIGSQDTDAYLTDLLYTAIDQGKKNAAFSSIARHENAAAVTPHEGVMDFIRQHRDDFTMAICSDNLVGTITSVLDHHGIVDVFRSVVAKDHVSRFKPDPEGLQLVSTQQPTFNLDDMVLIGNSWKDSEAAASFHIDFVDINHYLTSEDR